MTESQDKLNQYSDNDVSFRDILLNIGKWWRYLFSKWPIILVFGIVGAGLGYFYAYSKKTIYVANTTFVLDEDKAGAGGLGSLAGLASVAGVDLSGGGGGIFQGENILELYKSRKMIEKALLAKSTIDGKQKLLVDQYISFNKLQEKWEKDPKLSGIKFDFSSHPQNAGLARIQDSVMTSIVDNIRLKYLNVSKPDKKLSIIKAEVKSTDEAFSKAFNEQIVATVNDFYIQTKTKKSLQNVAILKHKSDSVRAVMNGAIFTGASVIDATPNLNPTRQVQRIAPVQRSQFNAEANKAILSELLRNLEITRMSLLKETPLIQVVDSPILPLTKERTGKLFSLVVGGILFGFLTVLYLVISKMLKEIIANG